MNCVPLILDTTKKGFFKTLHSPPPLFILPSQGRWGTEWLSSHSRNHKLSQNSGPHEFDSQRQTCPTILHSQFSEFPPFQGQLVGCDLDLQSLRGGRSIMTCNYFHMDPAIEKYKIIQNSQDSFFLVLCGFSFFPLQILYCGVNIVICM